MFKQTRILNLCRLKQKYQAFLIIFVILVLSTVGSSEAQTAAFLINQVIFPNTVQAGKSAKGVLNYQNAQGGVELVQFGVVDGRFQHHLMKPSTTSSSGQVQFELDCTSFSQAVSLRVLARDRSGRISNPQLLQFNCGSPPFYNFSQEQARVRPTTEEIQVHFFILDDGITSLSENATSTENPIWSIPSKQTLDALETVIIPALTGIWDQCSLAFELGQAWVVHPERLNLQQGTLNRLLFTESGEDKTITHGARSGAFLSQAQSTLFDELRLQGTPITLDNLVVFITGSTIVTTTAGKTSYIEGFGELSALVQGFSLVRPRYTIIRWETIHSESGRVLTPKQVVATLAHELGHNLGLKHPGEDGLRDTLADDDNLMKGSGVTPEPRANLLNSQCQQFLVIWSEMRRQGKAWAISITPGRLIESEGQFAIYIPEPLPSDIARGFLEKRGAFKITIRNNSALRWVVKISSDSADMGTSLDGQHRKPIEDLQIRVDGKNYLSLSMDEQVLMEGENGEFSFNVDFRIKYDSKTYKAGAYRAELLYTVLSR